MESKHFGQRLLDAEAGIERAVGILENHLDASRQSSALFLRQGSNIAAVQQDAPTSRLDQAYQRSADRGLATAALSNETKRLPGGNGKAHIVHSAEVGGRLAKQPGPAALARKIDREMVDGEPW